MSPVPLDELASQRVLLDIATGAQFSEVPSSLLACDRADLVRLVMCLGMFLTGWEGERRIEALIAAGPGATAKVAEAGVGCLRNWSEILHEFFSCQLAGAASRRGKFGARKALGPFYDWLNMMAPGPIKTALARAASDFLTADPVLARLAHRSGLVAVASIPDRPMGLVEAGRRIGVRGMKLRKFAQAGLIEGQFSDGPGSVALLNGAAVQRLAELAAGALDLKSASRVLGVSKRKRAINGT